MTINRGKRSKTVSEVKPVGNINENLQCFLEISPSQREVLPSHKLRDHAYEYQNPFALQEDNLSQRNWQNQLSHQDLLHIEQECQESLMQGKIHNQQNLNNGLRIMQFKRVMQFKLSGLHAFDDYRLNQVGCEFLWQFVRHQSLK